MKHIAERVAIAIGVMIGFEPYPIDRHQVGWARSRTDGESFYGGMSYYHFYPRWLNRLAMWGAQRDR